MMSLLHRNQQFSKGVSTSAADIVYHGLVNQGATDYLNSVLQVLFMTKDFREAVERCAPHNLECIDPQLRDVFDELLKRPSYTYNITKKLGIHSVYEQDDAAEYFEKILTLTSSDASQIFHGESRHEITCYNCHKENNTDGRFWHLPLELVDSHSDVYSVMDGIDDYFRTSHFSGENQMYCDHCETKSDATMTCVMKHHPEVLTLLLKRFDFDYRYMSYYKNNRVVVVPSSLQIPENQTYELYACVDHFGDLRGGHYTATIKSQGDERWYNFNDARVTLLDYQLFQKDIIERSDSAYLLFYRKKKHIHTQEISEVFTNGDNGAGVRQRKPHNYQEGNEESSHTCGYLSDEKQEEDEGEMRKDEEEEEGGKAETEDQTENIRRLFSAEAQLEERVTDQNCVNAKIDDVRQGRADIHQDLKPEASDSDATRDRLIEKDEGREVDMDRDGGNGNDKEGKGGETWKLELLRKNDVYLEGCEDTGGVGAGLQGGSRRLLEVVEEMVNPQTKERAGRKDARVEGGGGSDKTILYGEIIDKEIGKTPSGFQVRIERKPIRVEIGKEGKMTKIHYD